MAASPGRSTIASLPTGDSKFAILLFIAASLLMLLTLWASNTTFRPVATCCFVTSVLFGPRACHQSNCQ
eukprot:5153303-Amphidinium_carterae.2